MRDTPSKLKNYELAFNQAPIVVFHLPCNLLQGWPQTFERRRGMIFHNIKIMGILSRKTIANSSKKLNDQQVGCVI